MQLRIFLPLVLLCFFSCKPTTKEEEPVPFDKVKWRAQVGNDYPYREQMLQDVIANEGLKGLKKVELIELLGQPDRVDSSYLFYRVSQKRIGFFPLNTKTLVIKLASDSTVEWRKIHG
jgi:hypothetical protein